MTRTVKCGIFDFECKKEQEAKKKQKEEQEKLRKEEEAKQEALRKEREQKLCKKGQPKVDCIYETKMLDGEIRSEVYYNKNGKKDGDEKEWEVWTSENGNHQVYYVATKNTYKNGELVYKETFYPNGNFVTQENLKNGKRYGLTKIYKSDGSPSVFMEYGEKGRIVTKSWFYKTKEPTTIYDSQTKISTLTLPYNPNIESPKIEYQFKEGTLNISNAKCLNGSKKIFKTQEDLSKIQYLLERVHKRTPLDSNDYYICE